jgi:hypothetical protein
VSPSLHLQFLTLMMPVVRRSQVRFPVGDAEALARFRTRSERMANMVFSLHLGVTREGSSLGGVAGDWPIPPHAPDNPLVSFWRRRDPLGLEQSRPPDPCHHREVFWAADLWGGLPSRTGVRLPGSPR